MKLIDKDALVAEIRSRLHPVVVPHGTNYDDWDRGADSERLKILSFIDTLEVKEVDLEKEIDRFYGMYRDKNGVTHDMHDNEICLDWKEGCNYLFIIEFAKHFFKLGLKTKEK